MLCSDPHPCSVAQKASLGRKPGLIMGAHLILFSFLLEIKALQFLLLVFEEKLQKFISQFSYYLEGEAKTYARFPIMTAGINFMYKV